MPAFQQGMVTLAPEIPSLGGRGGIRTFRKQYLSRVSINDIPKVGEQTDEGATKSEGSEQSCDTDDGLTVTSPNDRETDLEVVQNFMADGWTPTDSHVEGDVITSPEGTISAFNAFIEAMKIAGNELSLDTVIEVAKKAGWDENTCASFRELRLLCEHFGVEILLETGIHGCFRFPTRYKGGLASLSLVCLGDRFGYIPQKCKEKGSIRKRVRFLEMHG